MIAPSEDKLVIADGFSCREQIRRNTNRFPLHLAEVLSMAFKDELPKRGKPETPAVRLIQSESRMGKAKAGAALIALLGTAAFGLWTIFGQRNEPKKGRLIEMPNR